MATKDMYQAEKVNTRNNPALAQVIQQSFDTTPVTGLRNVYTFHINGVDESRILDTFDWTTYQKHCAEHKLDMRADLKVRISALERDQINSKPIYQALQSRAPKVQTSSKADLNQFYALFEAQTSKLRRMQMYYRKLNKK